MKSIVRAARGRDRGPGWFARACRNAVLHRLRALRCGRLILIEDGAARHECRGPAPGDDAVLRVHAPQFWPAVALGGSVGAGASYIDGAWSSADLPAVVRLFVRNRVTLERLEGGWAKLALPLRALWHRRQRNSRAGSKRNIAAHYDLGDDLFALFLDDSMTYSSAFFARPDFTLAQAQEAKIDRLCHKLGLGAGDHLLEIGTGWGAFAVRAASRFGCRVTTTTISPSQGQAARARVVRAGLLGRVDVRADDYRDLRGSYDKLVAVEMVEAVGAQFLHEFFARCGALLRPHGCMALQAITLADQHYARAVRDVDFIKRYVFPGSFIPSTTALLTAATQASDLRLVHCEDLGPHYTQTLRAWRQRFLARAADVRALGYDERFVRLWDFYLAYCEGGFAERFLSVVQLVFAKPLWRGEVAAGGVRTDGVAPRAMA
jgi:cyclopropane-fatty-acyl-phospholipid synthase